MLYQTLLLAVAQVFAQKLDSFFQLVTMALILVAGTIALTYLRPLHDPMTQDVQVTHSPPEHGHIA